MTRRATSHLRRTPLPAVTALRAASNSRVEVELDGEPWRTVPVEVVLAAGLHVGLTLDREHIRRLRRELRSCEALAQASRLLGRRDLSTRGLAAELERRRIAPAARRETIGRLLDAGAVDDARSAKRRAEVLAARGAGNLLICSDLETRGFPREAADAAIAALAPERERARKVVADRGNGAATARYLARKGFDEDVVEAALEGSVAPGA
jgi:SOS response regulatory protein OraA/RecX